MLLNAVLRALTVLTACAVLAVVTSSAPGCGGYLDLADPPTLARQAASEDEAVAQGAVARLRSLGPDGLAALVTEHATLLEGYLDGLDTETCSIHDPRVPRVLAAIDAVGAQKDNFASRLYWYTDLESAKAAARDTGRPILSLRHLGRLDEEYSCANSRYLRTAVYSNAQVAQALRERFVLHWQSVRPVPKLTIDFGDGRVIERTITGNCCHYVLDADGRPLDAIPGLLGPRAFLGAIESAEQLHQLLAHGENARLRADLLRSHHARRLKATKASWANDLAAIGRPVTDPAAESAMRANAAPRLVSVKAPHHAPPAALVAAPVAVTKSGIELPVLRAIAPINHEAFATATDDDTWRRIAERHRWKSEMDELSVTVMKKKCGAGWAARVRSGTGDGDPERAFAAMRTRFVDLLAIDTIRNEYLYHQTIHSWFANGEAGDDVDALNERIYAELFLTPSSDPWLGLLEKDMYSALDENGV